MTAWACLLAGVGQLRSHRSRSLLTVLTIVVGIWAVTTTVAVGDMGKSAAELQAERTAGRPATLRLTLRDVSGAALLLDGPTRTQISRRLQRYGVRAFSPRETVMVGVDYQGLRRAVELNAIEPSYNSIRTFDVVAGTWITSGQAADLAPLIVVNTQFLADFSVDARIALGSTIRLGTREPVTARIVGVVQSYGPESALLYESIAALERWGAPAGSTPDSSYWLRVDPADVGGFSSLMAADVARWPGSLRVDIARQDHLEAVTNALSVFQLVLSLLAGVSLLTGGIAIVNLTLVTVSQRTHEFGLWRVFGATDSDVFIMVVIETAIEGLAGGLVGVILSAIVLELVRRLVVIGPLGQVESPFPVLAAITGLVVAVVLGLIAGVWPARIATKLDVVDAIRA
jgi:putative ABC transport system permease protein